MASFQLVGLSPESFAPLFALSEAELSRIDAQRVFADSKPGFPCRVSLEDAEIGEELLLLPYLHLATSSPYRASGPIFVRRNAVRRTLEVGEVTAYVTRRQISLRAYDASDKLVTATVCEGAEVAGELGRFFDNASIE